MKNIKFIHLNWKNWRNIVFILPSFILLILVFLNMFEIFSFKNDYYNKLIFALLFVMLLVQQSRIFFYKNSIFYNKGGCNIRINQFFPVNIAFADVSRINFSDEQFIITKTGGKRIELNLSNILESDKIRLKELFKKHINFV